MRNILILTTVLMSVMMLVTPVMAADLDPTLTTHLPPLIRAMSMRCDTLSQMKLHARTERGNVFRAICDEHTGFYRYRITMTPDRKLFIRPWSE